MPVKHFEARILIAEGKDPLTERRRAEAQAKLDAEEAARFALEE